MHPSNKYVNVNITSSNYYSLETRERCQRAITLDIEGRKIAQYEIYKRGDPSSAESRSAFLRHSRETSKVGSLGARVEGAR